MSKEFQMDPMLEVEDMVQELPELSSNLLKMSEEEALKVLGDQRVEIYQGLPEILKKRSIQAKQIVDFLMEVYPQQLSLMLSDHTLEKFLDQRIEEAQSMYDVMHKSLQDKMKVWQMDTMNRIKAENQIREQIMEEVRQTILYGPLKA